MNSRDFQSKRLRRQHALPLLGAAAALLALTWYAPSATAQEEIPSNYYPNLGFSLLAQDERGLFLEVAEAELCPCPGQLVSLSQCLQAEEGRCKLAEDVASLMMRRIKEDANAEGVQDALTSFITDAQTPREFDLTRAPVMGPRDAPVQIVAFSDFECPHCRRFSNTLILLVEEFGDQIAIYFKHFPLPQHTNAMVAAEASMAASEQGHFWELHDLLFESQEALQTTDDPAALILELSEQIDFDTIRFREDFQGGDFAAIPEGDREEGRAAGVNSTPSCFINGIKFLDDESFANLQAYIHQLL